MIRCLKKGKGDEQALAARCITMLCIQLGQDADEIMTDVRPVLVALLLDNSANVKARGHVSYCIVILLFNIASLLLLKRYSCNSIGKEN